MHELAHRHNSKKLFSTQIKCSQAIVEGRQALAARLQSGKWWHHVKSRQECFLMTSAQARQNNSYVDFIAFAGSMNRHAVK